MAEPIKWRSKIILVKPEPSNAYGVDPVPTGAANAMLMTEVTIQPMEGQEVSRNLETPFMGSQEEVPVGLYSVLTGSFELVGSGSTGVAPAWGPLLRACGVAQVVTPDGGTPGSGKVEYTPVSDGHESVAVHFQIGAGASANRYVILGARGTAVFTVSALGIPTCRVTLTGLFTVPGWQTRPTPVLTAWQGPQISSSTTTPVFTIDGIPMVLREFSFDLGCDVQQRILIGQERISIVDKAEAMTCTIEAVPMTLYNPVQRANAPAPRQPIVLQQGNIAGKIVTINAARAVQRRFTGGVENQRIEEWPLSFSLLANAGDDQWKITLT